MNLRNQRPLKRPAPKPMSEAELKLESRVVAQYSPTMDKWIGHFWDGRRLHTFEPRSNRERALQDGRDHYRRIFGKRRSVKTVLAS